MSTLEDKISISADGAELINEYLNELTKKLVKENIIEAYSIVSEAEMLFISEIRDLNKRTKATIEDVNAIINRHGSIDEVFSRYQTTSEINFLQKYDRLNTKARELVRRQGSQKTDLSKFFIFIGSAIGRLSLILIPILGTIALIQLNQYTHNRAWVVTLLDIFEFRSSNRIVLITLIPYLLFSAHELISGKRGTLFLSIQTSIYLRTLSRWVFSTGALVSLVYWSDWRFSDGDLKNTLQKDLFILWVLFFISSEIIVFTRDHLSSFYPLQPTNSNLANFVKLPYLLIFGAYIGLFAVLIYDLNFLAWSFLMLLFSNFVILLDTENMYSLSIRYYFASILLPLLSIGALYAESWVFWYFHFSVTSILFIIKYRTFIKTIFNSAKELFV